MAENDGRINKMAEEAVRALGEGDEGRICSIGAGTGRYSMGENIGRAYFNDETGGKSMGEVSIGRAFKIADSEII